MPEHVEGLPRSSDLCSTGAIEQGDNTQVTSLEHRRLEGWLAAGIEPASRPCQSARTYHSCYGRLAAPQNQSLRNLRFQSVMFTNCQGFWKSSNCSSPSPERRLGLASLCVGTSLARSENSGHCSTIFQPASGSNTLIAVAVSVVLFPKSFSSSTPS